MSVNSIIPSVCAEDALYMPELEPCDECDRLEAEFQEALEDAQSAAAQAEGSKNSAEAYAEAAEDAKEDAEGVKTDVEALLAEAREILEEIRGAGISRFTQVFTTVANQSEFIFSPTGYEYNVADYYSVYINGLKCVPSDFTKNGNVITLVIPISLAGQTVEIVVDAAPSDESE